MAFYTPKVNNGLRVIVLLQHCLEEWAGSSKNSFVSHNLFILFTAQSNISKVLVFPHFFEKRCCIDLKFVPHQMKLFGNHGCFGIIFFELLILNEQTLNYGLVWKKFNCQFWNIINITAFVFWTKFPPKKIQHETF